MRTWILGGLLLFSVCPLQAQQANTVGQTANETGVQRIARLYQEWTNGIMSNVASAGKASEAMKAPEERLKQEARQHQALLEQMLRGGTPEQQDAAAYVLSYAPDAKRAVLALSQALERDPVHLANNTCLALGNLAKQNPKIAIPLRPLIHALQTPVWNSQQKAALVVEELAARHRVSDKDGSLTAALIPMLCSQRVRVFQPARTLLPQITGQQLGEAAKPWAEWHARRYGRPLLLARGIYELLEVVHPRIQQDKLVYTVENDTYASEDDLMRRLSADKAIADSLMRRYALAIQLPSEGLPLEKLMPFADVLGPRLKLHEIVFSPATDTFVPFTQGVQHLRAARQDEDMIATGNK